MRIATSASSTPTMRLDIDNALFNLCRYPRQPNPAHACKGQQIHLPAQQVFQIFCQLYKPKPYRAFKLHNQVNVARFVRLAVSITTASLGQAFNFRYRCYLLLPHKRICHNQDKSNRYTLKLVVISDAEPGS